MALKRVVMKAEWMDQSMDLLSAVLKVDLKVVRRVSWRAVLWVRMKVDQKVVL